MKLSLIAAVAENGVIGRDGQLPWRLRGDLQYFKRITLGKPIVMGRKTWESLGRPLPGRTNIVVTRQRDYRAEGAVVVATLDDALSLARGVAASGANGELLVIGGEALYRQALPLADRLYITEVHADVTGDARFPPWERARWVEVSRERVSRGEGDDHDYSLVVYDRR